MKFYCRENELNKMNKRYNNDSFECIVIYGRRRVGKTALINKFCEGKKCISFPALNSTGKENLSALSRAIYMCNHETVDSCPEYSSFDDAFNEISRMCQNERIVFVIDEYPYLAKSDSSISSRLQHLIDHAWQDSKLFLILCGSSMSFMQNQVLGYESPLYGRRTAQFKINPLTYKETALFNPSLNFEANAYVYGITGGIPHYINKLNITDTIDNALIENFFDASSYLFEEPTNLLKQELREPSIYNSIITAIATGYSKLNEISTKSGIETGLCAKYINVLIDLGIIKKETPLTEKSSKKTIYTVDDTFFRFWYKFVPSNMSLIIADKMEKNYEKLVKSKLHDYMGLVFEKMCKDYLMTYADNLPFNIADIGQWWGNDSVNKKEIQIDILATPIVDENCTPKEYIIGSCKFKNEKIGVDELLLLQNYASVFGKGTHYYYYIFSLSGFSDSLFEEQEKGNVVLVELKDMY